MVPEVAINVSVCLSNDVFCGKRPTKYAQNFPIRPESFLREFEVMIMIFATNVSLKLHELTSSFTKKKTLFL